MQGKIQVTIFLNNLIYVNIHSIARCIKCGSEYIDKFVGQNCLQPHPRQPMEGAETIFN